MPRAWVLRNVQSGTTYHLFYVEPDSTDDDLPICTDQLPSGYDFELNWQGGAGPEQSSDVTNTSLVVGEVTFSSGPIDDDDFLWVFANPNVRYIHNLTIETAAGTTLYNLHFVSGRDLESLIVDDNTLYELSLTDADEITVDYSIVCDPVLNLSVSDSTPTVGDTITFTYSWENARANPIISRVAFSKQTAPAITYQRHDDEDGNATYERTGTTAGTEVFRLWVWDGERWVTEDITVTWSAAEVTTDSDWSSLEELDRTAEVTTDSDWSGLEEMDRQGTLSATVSASATSVAVGESVTITWSSSGATSVRLERGGVLLRTGASGSIAQSRNSAGSYTYEVIATDGTNTERDSVTVAWSEETTDSDWSDLEEFARQGGDNAPVISIPDQSVVEGSRITIDLDDYASDADDDELTFTYTQTGSNTDIDRLSGNRLRITGDSVGTDTITVTVSDGTNSASDSFDVEVTEEPRPTPHYATIKAFNEWGVRLDSGDDSSGDQIQLIDDELIKFEWEIGPAADSSGYFASGPLGDFVDTTYSRNLTGTHEERRTDDERTFYCVNIEPDEDVVASTHVYWGESDHASKVCQMVIVNDDTGTVLATINEGSREVIDVDSGTNVIVVMRYKLADHVALLRVNDSGVVQESVLSRAPSPGRVDHRYTSLFAGSHHWRGYCDLVVPDPQLEYRVFNDTGGVRAAELRLRRQSGERWCADKMMDLVDSWQIRYYDDDESDRLSRNVVPTITGNTLVWRWTLNRRRDYRLIGLLGSSGSSTLFNWSYTGGFTNWPRLFLGGGDFTNLRAPDVLTIDEALTCDIPLNLPASADLRATLNWMGSVGPPSVALLLNGNDVSTYQATDGERVTLTWQVENVESLTLDLVEATTGPSPVLLNGSFSATLDFSIRSRYTYRIEATGLDGTTTTDEVVITQAELTTDSSWSGLVEFAHSEPTTDSSWSGLVEFPQASTDSNWSTLREFPRGNQPPVCLPLPDRMVGVNSRIVSDLTVYLSDPDGDAVSIQVSEFSSRISISDLDASAHSFTINGLSVGTATVRVTPVDEHGRRGIACEFTVTVLDLTRDGPWSNLISNPSEDSPWSNLLISLTLDGPWSNLLGNPTEDGAWSNFGTTRQRTARGRRSRATRLRTVSGRTSLAPSSVPATGRPWHLCSLRTDRGATC